MGNERIERIAMQYASIAGALAEGLPVSTICEVLGIDKSEYNYLIHYPKLITLLQIQLAKELISLMGEF